MIRHATVFAFASLCFLCAVAQAGDVTIDFNGYANRSGGQINGAGLDQPVRWAPGAASVVLPDAQSGGRYSVDFFQNSGEGSSDFSFLVNDAGDGVAEVSLGGGMHEMVDDFEAGHDTLRLRTLDIVYNANNAQSASYFIHGLIDAHKLPAGSGPQTLRAVPGTYTVDNLYNAGAGNEDYRFMVDSTGQTSPVVDTMRVLDEEGEEVVEKRWTRDGAEYATFEDNTVKPRVVTVRFVVEADGRVLLPTTHASSKPAVDDTTYTFTMPMTIGSGGVNISSFGRYTIGETNVIMPDGESAEGRDGVNDFHFLPRLRWSEADGFYFHTTDGKSKTAHASASGLYDDGERPLLVKVKAEIVEDAGEAADHHETE